jgi:hypothetical protein
MSFFSNFVSAKNKAIIGISTMFVSVGSFASDANSNNYASQAMNTLKEQATALVSDTWPVVVTVVGAGLAIRLFKKFSSKAV